MRRSGLPPGHVGDGRKLEIKKCIHSVVISVKDDTIEYDVRKTSRAVRAAGQLVAYTD